MFQGHQRIPFLVKLSCTVSTDQFIFIVTYLLGKATAFLTGIPSGILQQSAFAGKRVENCQETIFMLQKQKAAEFRTETELQLDGFAYCFLFVPS